MMTPARVRTKSGPSTNIITLPPLSTILVFINIRPNDVELSPTPVTHMHSTPTCCAHTARQPTRTVQRARVSVPNTSSLEVFLFEQYDFHKFDLYD